MNMTATEIMYRRLCAERRMAVDIGGPDREAMVYVTLRRMGIPDDAIMGPRKKVESRVVHPKQLPEAKNGKKSF